MIPARAEKRTTTFKGDVLRLVSGAGLSQTIGLLAAPILTRIYAPEAFGVAALFASVSGILAVLACMRYELSIILPDNDREAANLLAVSLVSAVLIAALTAPIIGYGGRQILNWVRMPELAPYLWLVPLVVLLSGIYSAMNYWNTRTKHYIRLSVAKVTSQLVASSLSLGAGLAGHATGGALITSSIGAQAVTATVLSGQIMRDDGRYILSSITWREMWAGVKRHRKFPLYSSWGAVINTVSWQVPILMLGLFFSPAVVGFYSLGFRLIQIPAGLMGGAISQVFFQSGAEARDPVKLAAIVDALFKRMLIVGLLPTLILMVIGADLFSAIFGDNWREAGVFTQILAPWVLVWFLSSPLSTIYSIQEKQENELSMHGSIFITRFAAIAIGGVVDSPRIAIALFSMGGILAYGYLLYTIFRYSGLSSLAQLKKVGPCFGIGCISLAPVIVGKYVFLLPQSWVFVLAGALIFIYYYHYRRVLLNASLKSSPT